MGMYAENQDNILTNPSDQINSIHNNTDGWITLAKNEDEKFQSYHYKIDDIHSNVHKWVDADSYVSMNTFYTPRRLVTNLREIRTFFVDLDCYNMNLKPEQVVMNLKENYFNKTIPEPNLINYSGRGVNLIWFLDPLSGLAIERWSQLQRAVLDELKPLGSDPASIDGARIFRLAGSVNSKNGATVYTDSLHDYKYEFNEVVDEYFPHIKERKVLKPRRNKTSVSNVKHLFNEYTLIKARMVDIQRLVQLRQGQMEGVREVSLFLYRYWSIVETGSLEQALIKAHEVNDTFNKPISDHEVIMSTKSAEMYYEHEEGFRISNTTLIDWLSITASEQEHLTTIISTSEKNRRKRLANETMRRANGVKPRSEYEEGRKQLQIKRLKHLTQLLLNNPKLTHTELAQSLDVSTKTIQRLIAKL